MVQGAAVVLENKTGRILAMSGGFSYPLSQLNRVSQAHAPARLGDQAAELSGRRSRKGLQPNTLVLRRADHAAAGRRGAAPASRTTGRRRTTTAAAGGILTLRRALEKSRNLATARLLDGGIERSRKPASTTSASLAVEGADLPRMPALLSVRARRAAGAADRSRGVLCRDRAMKDCGRCRHSVIESHRSRWTSDLSSTRRARRARSLRSIALAFYQLKTHDAGRAARGTARAIAGLSPYVAGKTGTTDDENDAWFVGFTNDVTVAVWVGWRQCRRQAPHAGRRRDRRRRGCADLRADHPGGVGQCRPENRACPAVAGGQTSAARCKSTDLDLGELAKQPRKRGLRMLPGGCQLQDH